MRVPTPLFSATLPVYAAALKSGHAEDDTAAVCAVLEAKAKVKTAQVALTRPPSADAADHRTFRALRPSNGLAARPTSCKLLPDLRVQVDGSCGGMNLNFWLIQTFNGISYGALLFLVGSGLSLIFGVMRIVNLSHGSYFMLGGYVALTVIWTTGSWLLAIPVAALTIALLGLVDGARVPAAARLRSAAPGPADGRLRIPVPAGRARHLDRQQLRHQSARRAVAEHPDRRDLLSALSRLHDRAPPRRSGSCCGW